MISKVIQTQFGIYLKITILLCIIPIVIIFLTAEHPSNVSSTINSIIPSTFEASNNTDAEHTLAYRRQSCSCTRPLLHQGPGQLIIDETASSLCSQYASLRGFHQRVISISMYGPRENSLFTQNNSVSFLNELISDMTKVYPDWILRVYHDATITDELICSVECAHNNVDFCNVTSLGTLGSLSSYIPPKIWRFLPVGDPFVDVMVSRDLDSPLTERERAAVNEWLSSKKAWHSMRDNPMHYIVMLGGMWGFRPAMNRTFGNYVLQKMLDRSLITRYTGRGDQTFLSDNVWPHIGGDVVAHDSYLCTQAFANNSRPWPTRRPPVANDTNCFVGCPRPCCKGSSSPMRECPLACRPPNHPDWTTC